MASPRGVPPMLEEALGLGLTPGSETEEAVSADGAYYLERVTITEASEDDCEYEEIPDDNFSIPEGEEDLAKAIHIVQEQVTDTQILEQKTVLPSRHVAHETIEDFLCNFLIKMGMARTLDCFQAECKAREDLLKTQKERDFHRMHHKRIVQEKNKLISDLKGLRLHYASYEPTIRVLHEKHHTLLKEKMLTSLERDRAVWKVSALQATLNNIDLGSLHVPLKKVGSSCVKENKSECSAQKSLQTREENGYKPKMKDDRKASFDSNEEGTSKLSARSGLWPTPCILQQWGRGNSQTWNKTTPLQGTISKNQRSAGASRTPRPCQLEPRGRF